MRSNGALGGGILAAVCAAALACGGGGGGGGGGGNDTRYDLTVTKAGSGTGTISASPAGISCGSTCTGSYASGTVVTLTATTLDSSTFMGWDGGCSGTGTCVVTVSAASEVTATFRSYHDRPALTSRRVYYNAGVDGQFGTADDVAYGYNRVTYQAGGDPAQDAWYYGANPQGPDGQWFTADDVPGGYWSQPGSTYGWNTRAPGVDGKWFTADDPVTDWEQFGTTTNGLAINILYDDPGLDGKWFTADDVISGYHKRTIDSTGAEIERVTYIGPGLDGKWFTDDDVIGSYWKATYSHGNTRWASWDRQVTYTAPGLDGKWLTDDDVIGSCATHQFADDSQYWTTETVYDPGPDGKCFTADDQITNLGHATNTY